MLPRFSIPIGFHIVDNKGEGKSETDWTKVGGIIEDADVDNIGKLGSPVEGIIEDEDHNATEILSTFTYHDSIISNPVAYLEIGSSKLTT